MSATFPAVLISARTGDIFRVWPDGSAILLEEELFRSADELEELEPGHHSTLLLHDCNQGDEFQICPKVACDECDGRGWVASDSMYDRKRDECHGHPETSCEDCNGAGATYSLPPMNAPTIRRSELPLSESADAVLDLRGAA